MAAGNAALNDRRAADTTIENDRKAALDVRARDALEDVAAGVGERERDVPAAHSALALLGLGYGFADHVTGNLGAALEEKGAYARLLLTQRHFVDHALFDLEANLAIRRHVQGSYPLAHSLQSLRGRLFGQLGQERVRVLFRAVLALGVFADRGIFHAKLEPLGQARVLGRLLHGAEKVRVVIEQLELEAGRLTDDLADRGEALFTCTRISSTGRGGDSISTLSRSFW